MLFLFNMIKIAIFASGSGTNAAAIMDYFQDNPAAEVRCVFCNNEGAAVIQRTENRGIECIIFNKKDLEVGGMIYRNLAEMKIDLIVLAGFLLKIPDSIIKIFPDRILNIHPSLLPKFGGKGMYGLKVHEAVISNKEKESGISIHLVNENYDEGRVVFQARCFVVEEDTPLSLAKKIHRLEHYYFPRFISEYILLKKIK
jgi:phosphoribosylglycinamide formyltransferase-1